MTRKILIIYATAGIGHKKAALAIKKAFDEMAPQDIDVSLIDALDYTSDFFKWIYLKIYLFMVNKFPLLWGLLYYLTDNFHMNLAVSRFRRFNNSLNSKKLIQYISGSKPDVIISTHFFASEVISDLKKKGALDSHLITVVTDYRLHSWWVSDFVDTYVVGAEGVKNDLMRWGISPSKVKVLGIPVEPAFSKEQDKLKIVRSTGLEEGVFTVLVIGGGFGVGPIEDIIKTIGAIPKDIQFIVICGHNKELFKRIEILKSDLGIKIKTLGFVDNVYDFMEISDILISKSGGITVTESMAKELPMIIISPILGQETGNSSYLISQGAALKVRQPSELRAVLEYLMSNPGKIEEMKICIRKIKKTEASYDIARLALETANDGRPQ